MIKYRVVFFIFLISFIYLGNIYKNHLISIEIEEKVHLNEFISSQKVNCEGYVDVDCKLQDVEFIKEDTTITMSRVLFKNMLDIYRYVELNSTDSEFLFKFDGMDINQTGAMRFIIPKRYIPSSGIVKFDIINNITQITLDVNISKSDIYLELYSKSNVFKNNLNINFNKLVINNRDDLFTLIYEIYKINFLDTKMNSNKDFARGFNLSLGVDSYDLIDFKRFQGEPFAIFLDTMLSEVSNALDLDNDVLLKKIDDFVSNNKSKLVIKKGEIGL